MRLTATFRPQTVQVNIDSEKVDIDFGTPVARDYVSDRDPYTGSYTVTPTQSEQVLLTNNLRMTDNITVEAIPSYYGLITWNGSTLTVS